MSNTFTLHNVSQELVKYEIAKYLPEISLLALKQVNKRFYKIITEYINEFVKKLVTQELSKKYFSSILKNKQYITLDYVLKSNPEYRGAIQIVCQYNKQKTLDYIIQHGANDFNYGLHGACKGGHQHLAELMIKYGANNFNWGLQGACYGGHQHLAELMIKYRAYRFDWGLSAACLGGHQYLVELTIKHGATNFNWSLHNACKGGHQHLAEVLINHGADDFNWGLYGACLGEQKHLAELMIKHGATYCSRCNNTKHKFG